MTRREQRSAPQLPPPRLVKGGRCGSAGIFSAIRRPSKTFGRVSFAQTRRMLTKNSGCIYAGSNSVAVPSPEAHRGFIVDFYCATASRS